MQTSKTDHVMINGRVFSNYTRALQKDAVRSTSSAHIAVDRRKHYLHYKHFSTAETVTGCQLAKLSCLFVFLKRKVCYRWIVFDVTPPKPKKDLNMWRASRPPSVLHRFAQLIYSCSATMQN